MIIQGPFGEALVDHAALPDAFEFVLAVIKEKMDKDLDEVSKTAGGLKGELEALDKAVSGTNCILLLIAVYRSFFYAFPAWQNASNRNIKGCHEGSTTDRTRMAITS